MLGMHGTLEANLAMHDADLIVCVGARFDDRVTGRLDEFCPAARKIHIDIDPAHRQGGQGGCARCVATAAAILEALLAHAGAARTACAPARLAAWWSASKRWRAERLPRVHDARRMPSCRSS